MRAQPRAATVCGFSDTTMECPSALESSETRHGLWAHPPVKTTGGTSGTPPASEAVRIIARLTEMMNAGVIPAVPNSAEVDAIRRDAAVILDPPVG